MEKREKNEHCKETEKTFLSSYMESKGERKGEAASGKFVRLPPTKELVPLYPRPLGFSYLNSGTCHL